MTSTLRESLIFTEGHNSDIEEQVKDCLGSQELSLSRERERVSILKNALTGANSFLGNSDI